MAVISIDVGVKYFAFVEAIYSRKEDTFKIIRWKVEDIYQACPPIDDNDGHTIDEVVKHTIDYLNKRFDNVDITKTTVLIERQLPVNVRAFTLAHVLVAYFVTKGMDPHRVIQVNAASKPLPAGVAGKQRKSKKTLYEWTLQHINEYCSNSDKVEALFIKKNDQQNTKIDDLCDCFLQAVGNRHVIKQF